MLETASVKLEAILWKVEQFGLKMQNGQHGVYFYTGEKPIVMTGRECLRRVILYSRKVLSMENGINLCINETKVWSLSCNYRRAQS